MRTELSTGPIEDHLSQARIALNDAEDLADVDTESHRSIEASIRALLENLEDYNAVAERVDAMIDDLERPEDVLGGASAEPLGEIPDVDVTIEADLAAAQALAETVGPLADAEAAFWPAFDQMLAGDWGDLTDEDLEAIQSDYESAASAVGEAPASAAFEEHVEPIDCYCPHMEDASNHLRRVLIWSTGASSENAPEDLDEAVAELEEAAACGFREVSDIDDLAPSYWSWKGPILGVESESWAEDGTLYIDGDVTNLAPYDVEIDVAAEYTREDLGERFTAAEAYQGVDVGAGETWAPDEPLTYDDAEGYEGTLLLTSKDWDGSGPD